MRQGVLLSSISSMITTFRVLRETLNIFNEARLKTVPRKRHLEDRNHERNDRLFLYEFYDTSGHFTVAIARTWSIIEIGAETIRYPSLVPSYPRRRQESLEKSFRYELPPGVRAGER